MTDNQFLDLISQSTGTIVAQMSAQGDTWSQGLSFLAGLLCASAFVWASIKEW